MIYRGYRITKERTPYGTVIWVEMPKGPFDAPTMKRAREYIDAICEEEAEEATIHARSPAAPSSEQEGDLK